MKHLDADLLGHLCCQISQILDRRSGEFDLGRSVRPWERWDVKDREHLVVFPGQLSCADAISIEGKLHKVFRRWPGYRGNGDARGSCPVGGKQSIYLVYDGDCCRDAHCWNLHPPSPGLWDWLLGS